MSRPLCLLFACLLVSCRIEKSPPSPDALEPTSYDESYFSLISAGYFGRVLLFDELEELIIIGERGEGNASLKDHFIGKIDTLNQFSWITSLNALAITESLEDLEYLITPEGDYLFMSSSENEEEIGDYSSLLLNPFGEVLSHQVIAQPELDNHSLEMVQMPDGDLMVLGRVSPPEFNNQLVLQKITMAGEVLWSKPLPTTDSTYIRGGVNLLLQEEIEQLIALNGEWYSTGGKRLIRLRGMDYEGNVLWEKEYELTGSPGYLSYKVLTMPNQEIVIAYVDNVEDITALIKLNQNGEEVWHYRLANESYYIRKIIQTIDGNYLLLSTTFSYGSEKADILLSKIGQNGQIIWEKLYGSISIDSANDIIEKPDGTLIILGNTKHYTNSSYGHDMFLLHIDAKNRDQKVPSPLIKRL